MKAPTRTRVDVERAYSELMYRRAAADPEWFMRQCCQIPSQRDPSGREPFGLFDYQTETLETFLKERFAIVLKARQIGLSTLVGAYALWLCLFRPGSVVLWISNSLDNANKAIGMLDVLWNYLPGWMRDRAPELTGDQAGRKVWTHPDGMTSRIRAFAGTAKAGASETATLVVLDEFALVDDQDNLLRSADPTTDAGGALFIISTARGAYNRFAKTFRAAQKGASKFTWVFWPWMVSRFVNPKAELVRGCADCGGTGLSHQADDGYCPTCVDLSIYSIKAREFHDEPWLTAAEYPREPGEAFRESGRPRFPSLPALDECDDEWLRGNLQTSPDGQVVCIHDPDGPLRLAPHTVAGGEHWRDYVLFVDPATGTGGDYTAATVLGYDTDGEPERVAWWHHNLIESPEAARQLDLLGRHYAGRGRGALLAVETTGGWGDSMLSEWQHHMDYPDLYVERRTGMRKNATALRFGFSMNKQQRPKVIDRLAGYVSAKATNGVALGGIDEMLLHELSTFVVRPDGTVAADVGCHDDLVMSTAGALWVLTEMVTATERPDGERPYTPEHQHDLSAMFARHCSASGGRPAPTRQSNGPDA